MTDHSMHDDAPQDEISQEKSAASQINPGYVTFQLAKALTTGEEHADAATRTRAHERVAKWIGVLQGLLNGTLGVGSRTPLAGVPTWATLEVLTGGFATGQLLASGPLLEHERKLIEAMPALADNADGGGRTMLNAYFLSEPGLATLREQLRTGLYTVEVPEEGALLVVAWLLEQGETEAARTLLAELAPFFARLRFYPQPADRPLHSGAQVFLETVGDTVNKLQAIETSPRILAQKEAIELWAPLYDQTVRLFLETVEGEPPTLHMGEDGKPQLASDKWHVVDGGWPCRHYPEGWAQRSQQLLDEYHRLRQTHSLSYKPERGKENFTQLRYYLQRCVSEPQKVTTREMRWIRILLARYITKYGTPDSPQHVEFRRRQARQMELPIYTEIAQVVMARLADYDKAGGIPDLEAVTQAVSRDEAQQWQVKAETEVPRLIQGKVQRALVDSIEGLVTRGIITSSDTLARVLPQITSEIRAAGVVDPRLRQLYAAIYRAFRRRRSLLLLNLESQVRIEELPWVAAIERFRQESLSTRELARQTLDEVVTLAFSSFPYAILPNKLLQELRALAKGADLNIPFVDEVAADIFMGEFSPKFLEAAKRAAGLLQDSLYARYYGIDYEQVRQLTETEKPTQFRFGKITTEGNTLIALCTRRAGVDAETPWSVARNGMILEQQHILTTQNLATLFAALDLTERLRPQLGQMARDCFVWICQRQQMKIDEWHGRLIMVKNTAYAWRQMIFFLSFLSNEEVQAFLAWAEAHFREQSGLFLARFRPAMNGLVMAAQGRSLDTPGLDPQEARRFLGWTVKRHWLLE